MGRKKEEGGGRDDDDDDDDDVDDVEYSELRKAIGLATSAQYLASTYVSCRGLGKCMDVETTAVSWLATRF